ncbi:MAG: 3'-5' exonuclease, partial [Bacteriovoracales bacterium]
NKIPSLLGFLETITLDNSKEEEKTQGEVSLMTVHGAKGLEFPYVFLVGAEENLFPSYKSMEGGSKALEEERRLFYVAMTRAMKKLYITFARGRMLFGQIKFNGPSRFVDEIPSNFYLLHKFGHEESAFQMEENDYFSQESPYEADKVYQLGKRSLCKFESGSKVRHSLYGEGKVLDSSGTGDEEKVLIMFSGGVKKKFMASMAPIVRI